jgi:hypothetical protein
MACIEHSIPASSIVLEAQPRIGITLKKCSRYPKIHEDRIFMID